MNKSKFKVGAMVKLSEFQHWWEITAVGKYSFIIYSKGLHCEQWFCFDGEGDWQFKSPDSNDNKGE